MSGSELSTQESVEFKPYNSSGSQSLHKIVFSYHSMQLLQRCKVKHMKIRSSNFQKSFMAQIPHFLGCSVHSQTSFIPATTTVYFATELKLYWNPLSHHSHINVITKPRLQQEVLRELWQRILDHNF